MPHATLSLLTICGLDEIEGHGTRAVSHVLSILDPDRPDPDFGGYRPHVRVVLRFNDAIEPASGVILPTREDVERVLAFGRSVAADAGCPEAHLLVHCHAGISRSTAAMAMILAQAEPDMGEQEVLARVVAIRPQAWPNLRMIGIADELLGREGRLVAAVGSVYRHRLAAEPGLAEIMTRLDRRREVLLAEGRAEADI